MRHHKPSHTTFENLLDKLASDSRRLAGEQHTADDLYQEAVLFCLERAEQFSGQTAAYIRQRCYWESQHTLDKARFRSRNAISLDDDNNLNEFSDRLTSDEPSPEETVIAHETAAEQHALAVRLLEHVQQLPLRQRQIIHLLGDGLSANQIARQMRVSPSAVSQRLAAARATLRAQANLPETARLFS